MLRFHRHLAIIPTLVLACAVLQGQVRPPKALLANATSSREAIQKLNNEVAQVLTQVSPAVVQIRVTGFGPSEKGARTEAVVVERRHSLGSGVIVDPEGYILTNAHVIHSAQRIRVLLPNPPGSKPSGTDATRRRIFEAKVIGSQPEVDLALLKIEASNLPFLPIEKPSPVQLGEVVFAIGSPEGFENSVTMGIVSAANRQVENAFPMTFIQTDTAINPGNSGGPLVNTHGALVGINTFIMSRSGGSEGLGFAIPAPTAEFVYNSLRKYGRVRRVEMGFHCQPITPELAVGMNLSRDWGAIISDVEPDGSAQAAGIEPGDIIDTFDGHPIQNLAELVVAVANHPLDQTVRLKVVHGEQTYTLQILAKEATRATDKLGDLAMTNEGLLKRLGIVVVDIDDSIRKILPHMRSEAGVVVGAHIQDVTSPETGLRAGDIIRSLNKTSIDSVDGLKKLVGDLKSGDAVALQVEREGRLTYLSFEME